MTALVLVQLQRLAGGRSKDVRPKSLVISRTVAVPRPDDETFTSFFAASSWSLASSSTQSVTTVLSSSSFGDITAEDFDRIAISRDL